jgi:apolipoprotein N-acyltransferase
MRSIPWRLLAAAALSAALLDLPFPIAGPMPPWRAVFAWVALVPLLFGLMRLVGWFPQKKKRWYLVWSMLAGWLCGSLWFGANCYWVYDTMHIYGGMEAPMAVFALIAFSLYLGFWFGAFALAFALIRQAALGRGNRSLALVAAPFLWTAMEFALARVPEFPWDLLGYSQVDNGLLMRIAPWAGVYGVSFLLAIGNTLLVAGIVFRGANLTLRRSWMDAALSGKAWGAYGLVLILVASAGIKDKPLAPAVTAMAVLVQPNLDVGSDGTWTDAEWRRQMQQLHTLVAGACKDSIAGMPETDAPVAKADCKAQPSFIAWPESPAPFRDKDLRFQIAMNSMAQTAPVIVGNVGIDEDAAAQKMRIYNSASVIAMDGHVVGRYDKIHLVPFGEYVPMRNLLFFVRQVTQTMTDMSVGTDRKTFRIVGKSGVPHRYGVFICYESVFGDEIRQFARLGSEAFVNISDDGWYGDTSAPWQHLNMARMRAIENRRWILRDTNNGITASIDPYGTVRQSIARHRVDALAAGFGYNSETTFYTEHGDLLPALCAILSLGLLVWSVRRILGQIAAESSAKRIAARNSN